MTLNDLTASQERILRALARRNSESYPELADRTYYHPGSVRRSFRAMQKAGLVDRNKAALWITREGMELLNGR